MSDMLRIAPVVLASVVARTATADPTTETMTAHLPIAIAVNPPFGWSDARALGASIFVGLTPHQTLRLNAATWSYYNNPAAGLIAGGAESDGSDGVFRGRTTDVGVGWQYYPRRAWDGFFTELGALYRRRDVSVADDAAPIYYIATNTFRSPAARWSAGAGCSATTCSWPQRSARRSGASPASSRLRTEASTRRWSRTT
jgi:hypothetical protein